MTISLVVGQIAGADGDASGSVAVATPGNVAVGDLIVVVGHKSDSGGNVPFIAGNCTKSAGTATIGAISLASQNSFDLTNPGAVWNQVGVWYALVTGAGSLTMNIAGGAASYCHIAVSEWATTVGWHASIVEQAPAATTSTSDFTAAAQNMDCPALTSAGVALMIGVLGVDGNGDVVITAVNGTLLNKEQAGGSHLMAASLYNIVAVGTSFTPRFNVDASIGGGQTIYGFNNIGVVFREAAASISLQVDPGHLVLGGHDIQPAAPIIVVTGDYSQFPKNPIQQFARGYQ